MNPAQQMIDKTKQELNHMKDMLLLYAVALLPQSIPENRASVWTVALLLAFPASGSLFLKA